MRWWNKRKILFVSTEFQELGYLLFAEKLTEWPLSKILKKKSHSSVSCLWTLAPSLLSTKKKSQGSKAWSFTGDLPVERLRIHNLWDSHKDSIFSVDHIYVPAVHKPICHLPNKHHQRNWFVVVLSESFSSEKKKKSHFLLFYGLFQRFGPIQFSK